MSLGSWFFLTLVAGLAWSGGYLGESAKVILGMSIAAGLGLFFFTVNTQNNKWLWWVVVGMFIIYLFPFPYYAFTTNLPTLSKKTEEAVGRLQTSVANKVAQDSVEVKRERQCKQVRDADKDDISQKLAKNIQWRVDNARWLATGTALAQQYLAQYESGQAGLNAKLRAADAEYERCTGGFVTNTVVGKATPGGGSTFSLPKQGIVHAILYEWHWALTFLLVPFIFGFGSRILLGPEFIKSSRAKALGGVLALIWFVILMCLRAP